MNDDAVRRQLRFSLFLQAFAALMLATAAGVRIVAFGFDALAAVLLVGVVLIAIAGWFTWTRMRAI
jgi:hypothetical protein